MSPSVAPGTYTIPVTLGTTQVGTFTLTVTGSVSVSGATLSLAPGNGGTVNIGITGASSAPALALGGTTSNVYTLGGSYINYSFLNITQSSALLVVYVPATVAPGSYSIPITIGTTTVGTFTLTVPGTLKTQTITFGPISAQTVGTPLTLSASASSGLAVSYSSSSSSTGVCTVSGSTATFATAGSCTITASQTGSSSYAAATPVSQTFTVNAAPSTVSVSGATLSLAPGTGGTVNVTITGASSAPALALGGTTSNVYTVGGSYINYSFLNITQSSALLVVYVPATVASGSYSIPITIGTTTVGTFTLTVATTVSVSIAPSSLAPGNYNAFTATISGDSSAPTNLGLGGVSCVNVAGCLVTLSGSSTPLNFEFFNVTNSGASLGIYVNPSVTPGTYTIPITLGSATVGTLKLTVP